MPTHPVFPIQPILDQLVRSAVDVIPVAGAGARLVSGDTLTQYVAASDETARSIEEFQRDYGQGPGADACATGEPVIVPNLRSDQRFSQFTRHAVDLGLTGMYSFPLQVNATSLGALDIYRTDDSTLEDADLIAAQRLADVAAAYLFSARARNRIRNQGRNVARRSPSVSIHDHLTGLPNLALLSDRLDQALRRSPRVDSHIGVLLLELDRFTTINDLYGLEAGDQVLVEIAKRLTAILRPGDTLARLAGDEFVVLCEDLTNPAQIHEIAGRVLRSLAAPFTFDGRTMPLSGSVGVTFTRRPGDQLEPARIRRAGQEMLKQADAAKEQAKHAGGGRYVVVASTGGVETSERHLLDRDLPDALGNGRLRLVYQLIADAHSGQCASTEALLRWDHQTLGAIDPATIVATAERVGLMTMVGRWVLDRACADLAQWRASGLLPGSFKVAVNVSPTELLDPTYPGEVRQALDRHSLPAEVLCLELTESVLVEDSPITLLALTSLKALGITIALDDFGTGYSTMTYLRRLPADTVKIDRSFLAGLDDPVDEADQAIVASLITLSHALGLTVIAEGVETSRQLERLRLLGCDRVQGHLVSMPISADQLPETVVNLRDGTDGTVPLPPTDKIGTQVIARIS